MSQIQGSILFVENTPSRPSFLPSLLSEQQYRVRQVSRGVSTLEAIFDASPDLVLLSTDMPDVDSYEICQQLKREPAFKETPVIFISSQYHAADKARAFSSGGVDYIAAPFHVQEVITRIETHLKLLRLQSHVQVLDENLRQEVTTLKNIQTFLESALDLREKLAYMLVHDLRNPATTIMTIAEVLMRRGKPTDLVQEGLQDIYDSAQRLNSRINDLLVIARMNTGKLNLNPVTVDVNFLVEDVVDSLKVTAASKRCQLSTNLPDHGWSLNVDTNLFSRVLENLIINAIKFSPDYSKVAINVICPNCYPEQIHPKPIQSKTKIQVVDEGYGLPDLQKKAIFEQFSTGDLSANDPVARITQIGLGLTFCKLVTEAHGGQILVEDNSPKGTIFTLVV